MRASLFISSFLLLFFATFACAQSDTHPLDEPEVTISGFLDVFYVYDANKPDGPSRQPFLYNHNRHQEVNLNLGYLKVNVNHDRYRANLAFQTGTYANDNYAAEPGMLKSIWEANIGLAVNTQKTLWLDAGIFGSHLGFESAVSSDNPTLTRSLFAENSPYFLSGARLTYSPNDRWQMAALVVNGWQRIQRVPGNSLLSAGTQVVFKPSERVTLNWSTFIGTDDPDSTRRIRFFNDVYAQVAISDRFWLMAGMDVGLQERSIVDAEPVWWYTPTVILQRVINENWSAAIRGEYYHDPDGVIIPTTTPNGFQTLGLSANLDYSPAADVMWRVEGRLFHSQDALFETPRSLSTTNFFITTSIAIRFANGLD